MDNTYRHRTYFFKVEFGFISYMFRSFPPYTHSHSKLLVGLFIANLGSMSSLQSGEIQVLKPKQCSEQYRTEEKTEEALSTKPLPRAAL